MPLADGQSFAGYTILRHLGSGGMGEIYLAQHPRLPRDDALKVLPTEYTNDDEYRQRFNREADIAASLWHPHIVGIHDRGECDDQLWISMDYVEGTDAAQLLADRYPNGMPPQEVVRIVTAVAEALDYAHQRLLLHRDVKPANILMSHPDQSDERVLLGDFGIARRVDDSSGLTGTNMTVGTVAYAAPEQLMGETLDGRADQYALAATAFHLLTGTPLFQHSNPAVVISQHLSTPPPAIGTRRPALADLGPVFSKALAKAPADRYATCAEFATALGNRLGTVAAQTGATDATVSAPITKAPTPKGPKHRSRPSVPVGKKPSGNRRVVIGVAAAVALLVVAGVVILVLSGRERHEPSPPQAGHAPPPTSAPGPARTVPIVLVGADCEPLGGFGHTADGKDAFCSRVSANGDFAWSLVKNPTLDPTNTPGPDDETYAPGIEEQVELCVQQTGQSRIKCRLDVRQGNKFGPE
jgi:serine/threonine-protein kinase